MKPAGDPGGLFVLLQAGGPSVRHSNGVREGRVTDGWHVCWYSQEREGDEGDEEMKRSRDPEIQRSRDEVDGRMSRGMMD